ncbi:MAG: hypothetical protein RR268_03030 [Kiritimatiellia bacterium]
MTESVITLADLGHAFESALKAVSPNVLEPFAKSKKLLSVGGYRQGNQILLCALVANAFRSGLLTYNAQLSAFARTHFPEARLLSILSREVLDTRRAQWMAFFGKAHFLLALLMDSREDVRAKVPEWMTASTLELPDAETAHDLLTQAFAPIVRLNGGTATSQCAQERVAELREKLLAAEKKAKADRRTESEAAQKVLAAVKTELATAQFGITERDRKIEQLEQRLNREIELRDQRVSALLAVRQINLFGHWLSPCIQIETMAKANHAAPLLERVKTALEEQAQLDRAAGAAAQLRSQLDAVEEMLTRVDSTLHGAVVQHQGLKALREELVTEKSHLQSALGKISDNSLVALLSTRIDAATETDYDPLLQTLRLGVQLNLISQDEEKRLKTQFRRRVATWNLGSPDVEKDLSDSSSESQAIAHRNPALAKALSGKTEAMLFFDGHNILNGLGRYKQRRGTALTHEDARKRLERDARVLMSMLPKTFVHLVWDGPEMSEYTIADNVMGHYSGGEGEHRADRCILDQVRFNHTQSPDLPLIVVTDDNGFAGEAIKLGAAVCRLHDFEAFLNGSSL